MNLMRTCYRTLPAAAAALLLAACHSASRPDSVPTAIKAGQSWVVTRPLVAAQVIDTCSRPGPASLDGGVTGYWAPSRAQVDQLEAALDQLAGQIADPRASGRQYVGIENGSRRLIYINAFKLPDTAGLNPAREAVRVCDGGEGFWGAIYDPAGNSFSHIERNGGY